MRRKQSGDLQYSPTDLIRFMESPFASWMDRFDLEYPGQKQRDEESEDLKLIAEAGNKHEDSFLKQLTAEGKDVTTISRGGNAQSETLKAIKDGRQIIFQAALERSPFAGYADFLVRAETAADTNRYEVWDTKLSRKIKPYFLVQLCCYAEMLESVQGTRPEHVRVVLGNNEVPGFRTEDFFHYYLFLKEAFLNQMAEWDPASPPTPDPHADHGRWNSHAQQWIEENDHLIQVARITKPQIKKLATAGIGTMADLANTAKTSVKAIPDHVFSRLRTQAELQARTRERRRSAPEGTLIRPDYEVLQPTVDDLRTGFGQLPPAEVLDVYFDMEGFPLVEGGLEYLFGATHLVDGKPEFKDWWAHDLQEEQAAFEGFVDWVYDRWQRDPGMHVYHYASYEVTALRRLMGKFASREDEVDELLRNEVFVDLYRVVSQGMIVGEPSYSIKYIEHLYRAAREGGVTSAAGSVVFYANWIESGEPKDWQNSPILKDIRDYNQDDCDSTWELAEWLRKRQQEEGIPYVSLPEKEEVADDRALAREQESEARRALAEKLLTDRADPRLNAVATLLGQLIEFHRREAKPVWWRLFDRAASRHEDLVDDPDCIGDARWDGNDPIPIKQSLGWGFTFDPDQEHRLRLGSSVILANNVAAKGTLHEYDSEGRFVLKISNKMLRDKLGGEIPGRISLIPDEYVSPKPIPEAIAAVASDFQAHAKVSPALEDFILRNTPRIVGRPPGRPLIDPAADCMEQCREVVTHLDSSTLCIQGPPGAGKTFLASHLIVDLLGQGKAVGITSNSHKAVLNLLRACNERLDGQLRCWKVGGDAKDEFFDECPGAQHKGSKEAAEDFHAGLIAGTAWLFSRDEMVEKLDYLFIDEAGQVSVANLVAMSRATANIVMIGDQMQLEQPTQGAHPGQSGLSLLQYYLQDLNTIPEELGVFLGTSWRMHPEICRFISDAFYEGRLTAEARNQNRRIAVPPDGAISVSKEAGVFFVPVEHEGNSQESEEEAVVINCLTRELLGRHYTDGSGKVTGTIGIEDILFVSPYNAQVRRLTELLPEGARIGSVDKFQGQEARIVIVSMCASEGEAGPRGLDFLLHPNRINVALSRAQCLTIVVGDPRVAQTPCGSAELMRRLDLFCRIRASAR
jgi:predicted RecB family nuclease